MERRRGEILSLKPYLVDMIKEIVTMRECKAQRDFLTARESRRQALMLASQILTAPKEARADLANLFGRIAKRDKKMAIIVYATLRDAHVLTAQELRQELGLPQRGRIFPKPTSRRTF